MVNLRFLFAFNLSILALASLAILTVYAPTPILACSSSISLCFFLSLYFLYCLFDNLSFGVIFFNLFAAFLCIFHSNDAFFFLIFRFASSRSHFLPQCCPAQNLQSNLGIH